MSADRAGTGGAGEPAEPAHRSTTALLTGLVDQVTALFRKELQLFRAEVGEKMNSAFTAMGMIAAGLVLALVALNALAVALVAALAGLGLAEGWSALIVGVALAIIGYALLSSGQKSLKASRLTPERTTRSLQQDATVAKDTLK